MSRARRTERGATLIAVLIFVTVLSTALGVTMSLVGTNERATVKLRAEASAEYAADAAGQAAVRQLQSDTFGGSAGGCNTTSTAVLSDVYPAVNGSPGASAAVECTPDPLNAPGDGTANSSPGSALLTLGATSEDGIYDNSVNTRTFKVSGGIFSNSTINLDGPKAVIENVATNSYVRALGSCYGTGSIEVTPPTTTECNYASNPLSTADRRGMDPQLVPGHGVSFDTPAGPGPARTPPPCTTKQVYHLDPGLYTDASALNALTASGNSGPCAKSIVHLRPGTYFFDFTGVARTWLTDSAWVVGGTPTSPLDVSSPPPMTAGDPSCVGPGTGGSTTNSGVKLVFGGDSRMRWTFSGASEARIELCASNEASGPPIAIYGLKSAVGSVPAQSGCIVATPYPATGCPLLESDNDPKPLVTIRGTVYAPRSAIDMGFNNGAAQYFQWGLVARTIRIHSTGSSTALNGSVISVPDDAPPPFPTPSVFYLDVYVCPGSSTCDTSGRVRLRAKVQLSSASPPTATVLSWSVAQ